MRIVRNERYAYACYVSGNFSLKSSPYGKEAK